jgi:hypothetical protein
LSVEPNHVAALFDLALLEREHLNKASEARARFQRFLDVAPEGPARKYAESALQESAEAAP